MEIHVIEFDADLARLLGVDHDWEGWRWARVLRADPCAYCGGEGGTVDHIQARGARGVNDIRLNGTGSCVTCNHIKHRTTPILFLAEREQRMNKHNARQKSFFSAEQIEMMRRAC